MSEWFNVKDVLPDPDTMVEVVFSFVASGESSRVAWPCAFHPKGSNPPMFVFRSWMGEHHPGWCGQIIAWRFRSPETEPTS